VVPGIAADDVRELIDPLLRGEVKEIVFETMIAAADGREYPAEICMQYFADEVPPILVAVVHDTSDRQQLSNAA
jgi:two-component system CheB/CheR fusion protein